MVSAGNNLLPACHTRALSLRIIEKFDVESPNSI
jgi:hypothetical protein